MDDLEAGAEDSPDAGKGVEDLGRGDDLRGGNLALRSWRVRLVCM